MLDFDQSPFQKQQAMVDWPPPDAEALAHSRRLEKRIREEIETNDGKITFFRFMEMALHEPGLGYYSAGTRKLGPDGDFITAPEISPLFSICLARQCAEVLDVLEDPWILELGAGSGVMARDVLLELGRLECLPERYLIMETSAELRERQQRLLEKAVPDLFGRIDWLERLPEQPFRGVVLANEV
ncbi:MAG: SAM-dependent methyltransferase, partial [Proteobacteria bacterium]|nr:SAM-dependent methyltransferase [Pseudomonadota bacterium]